MKTVLVSLVCFVGIIFSACASRRPATEVASSAHFPAYAVAYPSALKEMNKRYGEYVDEARKIIGDFATYGEEFSTSEKSWLQVLDVVEGADRDGRSRAYVKTMEENDSTARFFEEEKEAIARRISNNVKTGAFSSGCECEMNVYGRVVYSLRDGVKNGVETRLRDNSEAHRLIVRYKKLFGKKSTAALEREAVRVSKASYIVYVRFPNWWSEIETMLGEAREVSRTLDDALKSERESLNDEKMTKSEKEAVRARISDMELSRSAIDAVVDETREHLAGAEGEIPEIRQEYEDAFEALCNAVFAKASTPSD
jgi:hypothetical protein